MVDITRLNSEINGWTSYFGIENFSGPKRSEQDKNAFAHAYASAHIAYDSGVLVSNVLGSGREYRSFVTDTYKAFTGEKGYSVSGVFRDGHRDMYNNHVGNAIANYALEHGLPKEAIGYLVADALRTGQLISNEFTDPRVSAVWFANPTYSGPSTAVRGQIARDFGVTLREECFPSSTPVAISLTETRPICDIRVGDTVLAFDPAAELGRGALVPRKVTRLYRNTTEQWVKLSWTENGEAKELIATPGHHFLDRFGNFPAIEEMLENGQATVVLASGELAQVTAERIVYSAETAHLFERAQVQGIVAGNVALKPAAIDAWQTYNFEVEDLHTYVAGGVRVHNTSGVLGRVGNSIDEALDRLMGGVDGDKSVRDKVTDTLTAPLHVAGELLSGAIGATASIVAGAIGAVASIANGLAGAFTALSRGDIGGAIGSVAAGIGEAVGSVVSGIGNAIGSIASGIADAVRDVVDTVSGWFDPVVLDLDGDGIELTSMGQTGAAYDFDDDGYLENSGWIGQGDGLLAYDANLDGKIEGARELSLKMWDANADTDFDGLQLHFDTNKDGVFDSRDADFARFRIWKDENANGKVDDGELLTLAAAGIRARDDGSVTFYPCRQCDAAGSTGLVACGFRGCSLVRGVLSTVLVPSFAAVVGGAPIARAVMREIVSTAYVRNKNRFACIACY